MQNDINLAFSYFGLGKPSKRRKIALHDVMPTKPDFVCALIFTEAIFYSLGKEVSIHGFDEVCNLTKEKDVGEAFLKCRKSGMLFEGRKLLTKSMVDFIKNTTGSDFFYIRCFGDGGDDFFGKFEIYDLEKDILNLNRKMMGYIEICDSGKNIYLRFRDDDSVMFISAEKRFIGEICSRFPNNVLEVNSNYIF